MTQANVLDLSRARDQLGYYPEQCLDQGLEEMAVWINRCGGWRRYLQEADKAPWTGF